MSNPDPHPPELYEEPLRATAQGAAVVLVGPEAIAIAMTPRAALATAEALQEAAKAAQLAEGTSGGSGAADA